MYLARGCIAILGGMYAWSWCWCVFLDFKWFFVYSLARLWKWGKRNLNSCFGVGLNAFPFCHRVKIGNILKKGILNLVRTGVGRLGIWAILCVRNGLWKEHLITPGNMHSDLSTVLPGDGCHVVSIWVISFVSTVRLTYSCRMKKWVLNPSLEI